MKIRIRNVCNIIRIYYIIYFILYGIIMKKITKYLKENNYHFNQLKTEFHNNKFF